MNTTQVKRVVCGIALVSLSTIRAASGQVTVGSTCFSGSVGTGAVPACAEFNPGSQTERVDFPGGHSFKVIVDVTTKFFLEIVAISTAPPGPVLRYPDATEVCIPYVGATSNVALGTCALYNVTAFDENGNEISSEDAHLYFTGKITYRIAWNFPTLSSAYDNPRGLRAEDSVSLFFDLTDGIFPTLISGQDPAVDMSADGFSQYIVVQQPHGNRLAGCLAPLNCTDPNNPNANVFTAGQTIPVKVVLNPQENSADLRLTYTSSAGVPHLAESAGHSNIGNQFRRTGTRFEFNWSTKGLAPGVYQLTIAPGTNSGDLFAPRTILVKLQ